MSYQYLNTIKNIELFFQIMINNIFEIFRKSLCHFQEINLFLIIYSRLSRVTQYPSKFYFIGGPRIGERCHDFARSLFSRLHSSEKKSARSVVCAEA